MSAGWRPRSLKVAGLKTYSASMVWRACEQGRSHRLGDKRPLMAPQPRNTKAPTLAFVSTLDRYVIDESVRTIVVGNLRVVRHEFQQSFVCEMSKDVWEVIHGIDVFSHL